MILHYPDPVARLLTFGKLDFHRRNEPWPDYLKLGITARHVPDLVRMAADPDLNLASGKSVKVWAPIHAVRTLGQLRAAETAPELVRLFGWFEECDWFPLELRDVFAMMGPAALPALIAYLGDESVSEFGRMAVPECVGYVGREHPETREECVAALIRQLDRAESNGKTLNALIIWTLIDLRAVEAMAAIRGVFARDLVDIEVIGDLQEVEIEMGVREHRTTPRPRLGEQVAPDLDDLSEVLFASALSEHAGMPVFRPKTGRNDPCPCGSGRKFKKCCLN